MKGYTLLELIVVIAMLTSVGTVMLLNGADSRRIARLEGATRQFQSALNQVQSYGSSGKSFPPGSVNTGDFDKGYGVYVTTDTADSANKKIILYGGKGGANTGAEERYTDPTTQVFETLTFEGGVYVSGIALSTATSTLNLTQGHVLFRRGVSGARVYQADNTLLPGLMVRLAIGSGGDVITRDVYIYSTGLFYVE